MAIYVVGHTPVTGPVKIGYSADPEKRLTQLRGGESCPWEVAQKFGPDMTSAKLEILDLIDGNLMLEQALHRLLADHRIAGEWFTLGETPAAVRSTVALRSERLVAEGWKRPQRLSRQPKPVVSVPPADDDDLSIPIADVAVPAIDIVQEAISSGPLFVGVPSCVRCCRPRWLDSTMCKAHDLDAWLRYAK